MASEACCRIPPVSADYTPRGAWDTVADFKTYIVKSPTASASPKRGLIFLYDAFGFAPQILQGADRLAALLGNDTVVILPDLLEGSHPEFAWLPANTPEKQALVKDWFDAHGDYRRSKPKLLRAREAAGKQFPSVQSWGVFGLCWGGKPAVLASGEGNEGDGRRISVSGTAHPGALDAADAKALTVPHIVLASKDEPADVVAQYKEIIEGQPDKTGIVETYSTMAHGWMGARAKLDDEEDRKEYERGYQQVAEFFDKYL
ncbi:hypothetical protein PG996_015485 [Apiospora saccharicola]|uniref:Dienelactone hydrolase domain-containing protein n=1 Tax=Apiospora saccharicola TaxID=335842 RepID=A0ABR1TNH1_9PEZI